MNTDKPWKGEVARIMLVSVLPRTLPIKKGRRLLGYVQQTHRDAGQALRGGWRQTGGSSAEYREASSRCWHCGCLPAVRPHAWQPSGAGGWDRDSERGGQEHVQPC